MPSHSTSSPSSPVLSPSPDTPSDTPSEPLDLDFHLPTFSTTLAQLRRSALSLPNRLRSIVRDASFVSDVQAAYGLPVIGNERCGGWYIAPEVRSRSHSSQFQQLDGGEGRSEGGGGNDGNGKDVGKGVDGGTGGVQAQAMSKCYFKSTDGHMGSWGFSCRRVNWGVLDVVGRFGGCIIVDSTRRGKSMPDALSKTIPIWCCIVNRAVFADRGPHELHTPPQAVSASEHAQMEKLLDGFTTDFIEICKPNVQHLRALINKPLRPLWVTQASTLPDSAPDFADFCPVVLCTASRRVYGAEASENGYIQGAADDQESWSLGLTAPIFWDNKDTIMRTDESSLPTLIATLMKREKGAGASPILVKPTTNLYVSTTQGLDLEPFDTIISCTSEPLTTTNPSDVTKKRYLHLRCQSGKLGSRDLRSALTQLPLFFSSLDQRPPKRILICCPTGKDLSVGVVLAILCLYADAEGKVSCAPTGKKVDKTFIKQRLAWLTKTDATLNPPRGTLQSVNAFLMPGSDKGSAVETEQSVSRLVYLPKDPEAQDDGTVRNDTNLESTAQPDTNGYGDTSESQHPNHDDPIPRLFTTLHNDGRPWTFTRTLTSRLTTQFSGIVTGVATFTPYSQPTALPFPASSMSTSPSPRMLVYAEEGTFVTSTNLRFATTRKYVYKLSPPTGDAVQKGERCGISVHFVDDASPSSRAHATSTGTDSAATGDTGERRIEVGGLFVELGDLGSEPGREGGVYTAKNREQHLCGGDLYTASWMFGRGMIERELEKIVGMEGGEGVGEKWWSVRYDVKGPAKDYVSETRYEGKKSLDGLKG